MRGGVVAVSRLIVALLKLSEPTGHAHAVAKRRQLQKRQIEPAAVEADQRWPLVAVPAPPKVIGDHVWAELRLVEHNQVQQPIIGSDLGDRNGDWRLKGI